MTTNQLLLELKADCERLRDKDLESIRSLVRFMLESYDIANRTYEPQIPAPDHDQKDHDEYIDEMSLGGQKYRMPR